MRITSWWTAANRRGVGRIRIGDRPQVRLNALFLAPLDIAEKDRKLEVKNAAG